MYVLLVDDMRMIRRMGANYLEMLGCTFKLLEDGDMVRSFVVWVPRARHSCADLRYRAAATTCLARWRRRCGTLLSLVAHSCLRKPGVFRCCLRVRWPAP